MTPGHSPRRLRAVAVALLLCVASVACTRAAVSMRVGVEQKTPLDASVHVDERFIGLLGHVARRGVRLPEGEHRITITRDGYFPWDRIVVSDRKPILIDVRLVPVPD